MFCTENEALTLVKDVVNDIDKVGNVIVAKRVPLRNNPLAYEAYIACQTSVGNEALITKLMAFALGYDDIEFAGSDVDVMQGGTSVNDFVTIKAIIRPQFKGA